MLRHFLLAITVLVAAAACDSGPETAETVVLDKIKLLKDAGSLDYAAARKFFGVPLRTSGHFKAIANGGRIIFRSGEYHGDDTPEFSGIGFNMEWRAEPFLHAEGWRKEKGLKSSLRASFDQKKICITKGLMEDKLGSAGRGGMMDSTDVTMSYGKLDKLLVSFTFGEAAGSSFGRSECARNVTIMATDTGANWVTPTDASAGDAEFAIKLLPLELSVKSLIPLGFECGPGDAPSSQPGDTGCVCPRGHQTPAGPCRHAVMFIPYRKGDYWLKEGDVEIQVLPLHLPDMN